jgi:hypothetical protein
VPPAARAQPAGEQVQPQELQALPAEPVQRPAARARRLVQARLAAQAQPVPRVPEAREAEPGAEPAEAEPEGAGRDGMSSASGQSVSAKRQIARSKSHARRQVGQIASLLTVARTLHGRYQPVAAISAALTSRIVSCAQVYCCEFS